MHIWTDPHPRTVRYRWGGEGAKHDKHDKKFKELQGKKQNVKSANIDNMANPLQNFCQAKLTIRGK